MHSLSKSTLHINQQQYEHVVCCKRRLYNISERGMQQSAVEQSYLKCYITFYCMMMCRSSKFASIGLPFKFDLYGRF